MRAGSPIEDHPIKDHVNTQIQTSTRFAEIDACIASGMDWWKWETGFYAVEMKTEIVAWHRMNGLIKLHAQDAVNRKRK